MVKLPNIFKTPNVVVSQGLHGQSWNGGFYNVAIDFAYIDNLICPFDNCEIVTYSNSFPANIRQSYFGLKLPDGSVILVVHAKPVKMGKVNKGEPFAWCTWHHYHLAILISGKPECILEYLDRSINLSTQASLYGGDSNHPDCWWSNYADKYLNIQVTVHHVPQTQPTTVQLGNDKMFRLSKGGWRSQVIQELIDAGIWHGTWQANEQRFFELNGTVTPQGGWKPGDHVKYDSVIVATVPTIPESTQPTNPSTSTVPQISDVAQVMIEEENEVIHPTTQEVLQKLDEPSQVKTREPLPHWMRSIYDTLREGSYAGAGILLASGGWDLILAFLNEGDFSESAATKLLLGIGAGIAGYIQALMKEERKRLEKTT